MHQALPALPGQRRRRGDAAYQIGRTADEVLRGSHIPPVAGVDVARHLGAVGEQRREELALHRDLPAARDEVDDAALEDVGAGIDLVGGRIFGLLQKRQHISVTVGRYRTEGAGVADPHQVQGDIGIALGVGGQHGAQVHPGEHVTVEHHHGVIAQFGYDVGDTATGAQRGLFGDVVDLQAEFGAVAEFCFEGFGSVGGAQHHMFDPGRGDPGQQVGQERQTGGRQHRLGRGQGQRPQPGALPADQHDGVHLCRVHRRLRTSTHDAPL